MRRNYLTVENGLAVALGIGSLIAGILARNAEPKVSCFALSLMAFFYLALNVADTKKTVCPRCGARLWNRRSGKSEAERVETQDDTGEVVRIAVVCPNCGNEKIIWKKKKAFTKE